MSDHGTKIAVIGMAGRFPGANNVTDLWRNVIEDGHDATQTFDVAGKVGFGVLEDAAMFDNAFFDMSPSEARSLTPEHRIFLECVWAALEDAGMQPGAVDGFACVYASASNHSGSYLRRIVEAADKEQLAGVFSLLLGNAMDSLATRVGYKLGLRGECITVQTHCSSSLTAVHLACQSLLSGHSDIAIAGGVSVRGSVEEDQDAEFSEIVAQEGFILSPDGECHALLETASGTISGDGVGVVVLKMLQDAIDDGDRIYAVIPGTGINNDGKRKVGFTAPSLDGVTDAIEDALAFADLDPEDIGFIECHGTGTDLGDAIELRALRQVFDENETDAPLYLGSVKSNIGHLAAAAGVVGLMKTILTVYNGRVPALAHAKESAPHREVQEARRLKVPTEATAWPQGIRRAGVSSLGIGGTNVHVLVEQAPPQEVVGQHTKTALLTWSAKTSDSAERMADSLASYLGEFDGSLADVAHSLARRTEFAQRRAVPASSAESAARALSSGRVIAPVEGLSEKPAVAFMFSGYGAQRPGIGAPFESVSSTFVSTLEEAAKHLSGTTDIALRQYLCDPAFEGHASYGTGEFHAAIIAYEVAAARALIDWGFAPIGVVGSSLGEYAAAVVSGALSFADALRLVFRRGQLFDRIVGAGGMLMVDQPFAALSAAGKLTDGIEEGIRVSAKHCVLTGPVAAIAQLEKSLETRGEYQRRMPVDLAAHSAQTESLRDDLLAELGGLRMHATRIPYVSNVTGDVITEAQLTDSEYWFTQMRSCVQIERGLKTLRALGANYFLEVGPGLGLTKFADWNFGDAVAAQGITAHPKSDATDDEALAVAIGTGWVHGLDVDREYFGAGTLISVPTYAFERHRFYLGEKHAPRRRVQKAAAPEPTGGRSSLEVRVTQIWSDVLGVVDIGLDENFFDLGGDSLQATRVLGRLQSEITPQITVQDVMERRTIRTLVEKLETLVDTTAVSGDAEYYCSFDFHMGDQVITAHLSMQDFDEQGVPPGATNIRILE